MDKPRNKYPRNAIFFQKEKTAKISSRENSTIKVVVNQSQAVARRCSVKKVFLEISQISQENNFFGTFAG